MPSSSSTATSTNCAPQRSLKELRGPEHQCHHEFFAPASPLA
ncbi:hypothetical protein D187_005096 [Cystobacter fuscus DSM 2262]|uniref:Uncharacterized protein n=1 Tax=Cystobacter fuscus (strain ATCC 25194 / DSM 2262 / NBRC 100088 / M29) TaxID=1242864 RepID=S9R4W2_CYSF2|nr:hypothetical protein D187_005096 [Cystobacter fuscus DSM 2262]